MSAPPTTKVTPRSGPARVTAPPGADEPSTGGSNTVGRPTPSIVDSDQLSATTSHSSVAEASLRSVPAAPPNIMRRWSLGSTTDAARAIVAGSCSTSQRTIGPVMPGTSGLARRALRSAGRPRQCASWSAARRSGHSTAGRSACPASSTTTAPCIWPAMPAARTPVAAGPSAATADPSAASHAAGGVSAQPGDGASSPYPASAAATTRPSASTTAALSPLVPRSTPRYVSTRASYDRRDLSSASSVVP